MSEIGGYGCYSLLRDERPQMAGTVSPPYRFEAAYQAALWPHWCLTSGGLRTPLFLIRTVPV